MGYYCTVPQCTSLAGKTKNVKFHRFPRDITMADKWNSILKRGKPYTKYSKVCSLHFTQSDYNVTTMGQWKTLSKDAIPSQNLPKLNPDGTPMVIRKSRTVKYKETKKIDVNGDKSDKWIQSTVMTHTTIPTTSASDTALHPTDAQDTSIAYRLQTLNAIANHVSPQHHSQNHKPLHIKPEKQDAFIQTDPVQSEEDENQPNNSYSEASEKSYNSDQIDQYTVPNQYQKEESFEHRKSYELPKDYTKTSDDYIPQTNEEYNKEAEKYALERKSHGGYEKPVLDPGYQKLTENGYQKLDMYTTYSDNKPDYQNRAETYLGYQNGYTDSVEMLRNQQHNLQMLQEQHRINENQNFFNENHIKQEVDVTIEDDKFLYERSKDQLEATGMYGDRRLAQQRLLDNIHHQVKQEPDAAGCETALQPQQSPYYPNGHNDATGGYYEPVSRPGPELLIAKQNALAAHTQLWQNTMKRPFFYSEAQHYNTSPLLHRYDEISRILQ